MSLRGKGHRVKSSTIEVTRRKTYDFGNLEAGGEARFVVLRSIPAPLPRGTLMVRVHSLNVGQGSDGNIAVVARADGFTPDDPSQLFFGETLGAIVAASDGDGAPRYELDTFGVPSDHLVVEVRATQDSSSSLALSAKISIELLLDEGTAEWTPAKLDPVGWWRADLGHTATDGNPVASWANQGSDPSLDVSQGTANDRPTFIESDPNLNGQSSFDFQSGDGISTAATDAWQLADGEPLTVVVVCWPDYTGSKTPIATTDFAQGGLVIRYRTDGGNSTFEVYDSTTTGLSSANGGGGPQAPGVLAGVFDASVSPTDDDATLFINGSAGTPDSGDIGAIQPNGGSGTEELNLGSNKPSGGGWTGEIAEIIYHKALLSAAEDAKLTSYLNDRYGLTLTSVTR